MSAAARGESWRDEGDNDGGWMVEVSGRDVEHGADEFRPSLTMDSNTC